MSDFPCGIAQAGKGEGFAAPPLTPTHPLHDFGPGWPTMEPDMTMATTNVMDATDGRPGGRRKPSVYIRLDPSIADALADAAEQAGLSAAGWVRQRIVEALPGDHEIKPSLSVRTRIPPEDLAVVSQLSADVSRMGGRSCR